MRAPGEEEEIKTGPVKVFRPVRRMLPAPAWVSAILALAPSVMSPVIKEVAEPVMLNSAVPEAAELVIVPALKTTATGCVVALTLTPLRSSVVPWRRVRL